MRPINIEKLLSHSIGISNSYYRPTENDLLEDYLNIVDFLSLDSETLLQRELSKNQQQNTLMNEKLNLQIVEKDKAIQDLDNKFNHLKSMIEKMFLGLNKMPDQKSLNLIAQTLFSNGLVTPFDKKWYSRIFF